MHDRQIDRKGILARNFGIGYFVGALRVVKIGNWFGEVIENLPSPGVIVQRPELPLTMVNANYVYDLCMKEKNKYIYTFFLFSHPNLTLFVPI